LSLYKNNELTKLGRNFASRQISLSVAVVIFCTLVSYIYWEKVTAISVLMGGLVGVLPNIVFAYKAFKYAGATASKLVVESFFSGVKIKMVLTAVLFTLTFKFLVIEPIPFFIMFCLVMVLPLLLPLFKGNKLP